MSAFLRTAITIALLGPIANKSYYSLINSDTTSNSLSWSDLIISITIGTVDSLIYGIALYMAVQEISKSQNKRLRSNDEVLQYYKYHQSIFVQEKHLLNPMRERLDLVIRTQTSLRDLIKELAEENMSDFEWRQNVLGKLETLDFIQRDGTMAVKENIDKALHLFNKTKQQQLFRTYYSHRLQADSKISLGVDMYILTVSLLLYTFQIARWILQYLAFRNPTKYLSYSFILSTIILSHSLGFIYFLHIIPLAYCLFPLYICIWILFLQSFASIYHCAYSID